MKYAIFSILIVVIFQHGIRISQAEIPIPHHASHINKVYGQKRSSGDDQEEWNYAPVPRRFYNTPRRMTGKYAPRKLSEIEHQKLEAMYGADIMQRNYNDFVKANEIGRYGANEHKIPWHSTNGNQLVDEMNKESLLSDAKLSAINYQGTENVKMYNNKNNDHLDSRVHGSSSANILNQVNHESQVFRAPPDHNHCNIHGMWISSVAGVAIELLPIVHEKGRVEIKTRIFELQNTLVKGILTSKWTGNGVIYPDSPTTMTIVFQEHMNEIENHHGYTAQGDINSHSEQNSTFQDLKNQHPKTAVFVGQCLVCQNTPVLKGTWTVLLHAQSCANQTSNEGPSLNGVEINSNDTLHLLEKSPP